MTEDEVQRAGLDYLQYLMNQGKLWFTRLNSGEAFVKKGGKYYKISLCPPGTADAIVIRPVECQCNGMICDRINVLFPEFKSKTGKQSPAQKAFQAMVEAQGYRYVIIRSVEKLMELVPQ